MTAFWKIMPFCFLLTVERKVDDVVFVNEREEVSYLTIIMFSFIIIVSPLTNTGVTLLI